MNYPGSFPHPSLLCSLRCFVTLVAATGTLDSRANSMASQKAVEIAYPSASYFSISKQINTIGVFKLLFPIALRTATQNSHPRRFGATPSNFPCTGYNTARPEKLRAAGTIKIGVTWGARNTNFIILFLLYRVTGPGTPPLL